MDEHLHAFENFERNRFEGIHFRVNHEPWERMVNDIPILVCLRHMNEMVSVHHTLLRLSNFISVSSQYLIFMEFKLHIFIIEHLPKNGALIQINQAKNTFAKFDLNAVHLNLFFDLVDDFKIRIFAGG